MDMSCREKSKAQKKLKEMKIRAWRLALGGRKRLSIPASKCRCDIRPKKLNEKKWKEMKIRTLRQARIFISFNFFGLLSAVHVYIICICIYIYLFLERVWIIVRRGRRTASFWRVNSCGVDLHPREVFARKAPSTRLRFSSLSIFLDFL